MIKDARQLCLMFVWNHLDLLLGVFGSFWVPLGPFGFLLGPFGFFWVLLGESTRPFMKIIKSESWHDNLNLALISPCNVILRL